MPITAVFSVECVMSTGGKVVCAFGKRLFVFSQLHPKSSSLISFPINSVQWGKRPLARHQP
jgi:hypothetical protein